MLDQTVFKLLPKFKDPDGVVRYFTPSESRVLINTLAAKVHNAKQGKYDRTDIYDDQGNMKDDEDLLNLFIDERVANLETYGLEGVVENLSKTDPNKAEYIASEIENELNLYTSGVAIDSAENTALDLLKSEVLVKF